MIDEWVVVLAVEVLFLVFGIGAAWAVMNQRVKQLEKELEDHLSSSDEIKERLVRIETLIKVMREDIA